MIDISKLKAGDSHYKAYVGPPLNFDIIASMQFNLLTAIGLRSKHKLLDIGCGSLRAGRLLIPYLDKGNYFGIEPNKWLVKEGIKNEIGRCIKRVKKPHFNYNSSFKLDVFNEQFNYIIAQSIFSHASAKQIKICLENSKEVLKKDGIFMATFILSEKENYTDDDWVYPGCVKFTHDYISELIHLAGLELIKTEWMHPGKQTWYMIFNKSNKTNAFEINKNLFEVNKIKK